MKIIIKEYLVTLGFDVVKDNLKNKSYEKQLRDRLDNFIERQLKHNELCSVEEEIDFEGLANYLGGNLKEDIKKRLFGEIHERDSAHKTIVAKVKEYANANTKCGEKRAIAIATKTIGILRDFYRSKTNSALLFMSAEIVDDIINVTTNQHEEIITKFDKIETKIDNLDVNPIDKIILTNQKLLRDKNFSDVEENISRIITGVCGWHDLHPHYGYTIRHIHGETHLASIPLTSEAKKLYPPVIRCKGTAKMNGTYLKNITPAVINYANRHQLPIILNVSDAQKLLGRKLDPIQYEAEELIGREFILPPQPFPEAFACSISFNKIVEFDYVLFRAQEILDDGTVVLSNIEQTNFPFHIEMKANLENKTITFNINIFNPSNKNALQYARIIKKAEQGEELSIKVLKLGQELTRGNLSAVKYESSFKTIDEEIRFFEMIVAIEEYFGITIVLPKDIMVSDYNNACYLFELIQGEMHQVHWSKVEFTIELSENLRNNILSWDGKPYSLSYVGTNTIPLWGETYNVPIIRKYVSVKPQDIEHLKEKAKVLDLGDQIKLVYLPANGEKGIYEDSLQKDTDIFPKND